MRGAKLAWWWPSVGALALVALLRLPGWAPWNALEERLVDYRLVARGGGAPPHRDVVIVAIDDRSIETVGRWPWPRKTMAELLRRIAAAQPKVVAMDIVQSEPTAGASGEEEDRALAVAVEESRVVVLGYFFDFARSAGQVEPPQLRFYDVAHVRDPRGWGFLPPHTPGIPALTANLPEISRAAADLGYFNFFPDPDGTLRHAALALRYGNEVVLPLALATLRQAFQVPARIRVGRGGVEELSVGDWHIPVDRTGALRIDYRGPARTFPHVSAMEVLAGRVEAPVLHDKIVLVGVTATAVYDLRVTPFSATFPGVELHANVIDNVLQQRFLRRPEASALVEVLVMAALALGVGRVVGRARGTRGALGSLGFLAVYALASEWCLRSMGLLLPLFGPIAVTLLAFSGTTVQRYVWEERERRKLRRALELYLNPAAAALVAEHPERLKLGGEKVECTVLFSDVQDFTAVAERMSPESLVELLNAYLGAMTEIIFAHGGMLDKYMGDGIMAVWGVPLPQPDHAARACRAALAMEHRLAELQPDWERRGWPALRVRIGINSGPVVFGNMGSAEHLSLTVVGDHVNLASRLEGLNKVYGTRVLVTEFTVRALPEGFVVREIGTVQVKGRAQPVRVFELLAAEGEVAAGERPGNL